MTTARFNEVTDKLNKTARFNEVSDKLNKMFKGANEDKKDAIVAQLKSWLTANKNTNDKAKKEAIECFLADNNIF